MSRTAGDAGAVRALLELRAAEREQAAFYRALAALAEDSGDEVLSERFNELHADEQHHVSRISARLLELGVDAPADPPRTPGPASLHGWEAPAREREEAEIGRYEAVLAEGIEARTETLLQAILATERAHAEHLGGKWTAA